MSSVSYYRTQRWLYLRHHNDHIDRDHEVQAIDDAPAYALGSDSHCAAAVDDDDHAVIDGHVDAAVWILVTMMNREQCPY